MTRIRHLAANGFGDSVGISYGGQASIIGEDRLMERTGWVVRIGAFVGGTSQANPTNIQLGLWKRSQGKLGGPFDREFSGNIQLTGEMEWRGSDIQGGIPLVQGHQFMIGFGSNYGEARRWRYLENDNFYYHLMYSEEYRTPPVFILQGHRNGVLVCYYDYVPNKRPLAGEWVGAISGDTTSSNPLWTGTLPHDPAEENLDKSQSVRVRIYDVTNGRDLIYDKSIEVTETEQAIGQWRRRLTELTAGRTYEADFLHVDQFGWTSPFSEVKTLRVNTGPNPPSEASIDSKIDTLTPSFTVRYSHAQNTSGDRLITIIRSSATGTEVGRITKDPAAAIENNSLVTIQVPSGVLSWGQEYEFIIVPVDIDNLTGDAARLSVRTNSFPLAPSQLSPPAGSVYSEGLFSAYTEDPDGDAVVSADITISSTSTGQTVIGPTPMTVSPQGSGALISASIDLSGLTLGENYSYTIIPRDSVGAGQSNDPIVFTYARVPTAILISPSSKQRRNLIPRPSAELSAESYTDYWTITNPNPLVDSIEVFVDEDSAEGDASYRAIVGNGVGLEMRGDFIDVDSSHALLFGSEMKKEFASGVSASRVYLECFDSSNASLGVVYPVGKTPVDANGVDLPEFWVEFGGVMGPEGSNEYGSSLPLGTRKVQPVWEPGESAPVITRSDAFWLERLPLASSAIQGKPSDFFGYIPVAFSGFGSNNLYSETYTAQGIEKSGSAIANQPEPEILIDYASPDGLDKIGDRLVVRQEVQSDVWEVVHSGDWFLGDSNEAGDRERLPVPPAALRNQGRYSIEVIVRDSNGIEGSSPRIQIDTIFRGPPQVQIANVEVRPEKAEFGIIVQGSELPQQEFGGIEIARQLPNGITEIIDFVPTQEEFQANYRFPTAGVEHKFLARQISLANGQEIQSRWTAARSTIDYDEWWIKDILDSGVELPIKVLSADEVSLTASQAEVSSFRPLGSRSRSYITTPSLQEDSQLVMRIRESDPNKEAKVDLAENLRKHPRVVCILSQRPPDKVFARITQVTRVSAHIPLYAVYTFEWSEAGYSEDYYARNAR